MKKVVIISLVLFLTIFSIFSSIEFEKELSNSIKEYLSYRTDKKVSLKFEEGFKSNDKYEVKVVFNFDGLSFTLPVIYSKDTIYNDVENSLNIALTKYLPMPKDDFIIGNIENTTYSNKNNYKKGTYFYLLDINDNKRALIRKLGNNGKFSLYENVYSENTYPYYKLKKAKSLTLSFSPALSFNKIGGGLFFDIITLPYLNPISLVFGGSFLYNTYSNFSYIGHIGVSYSANISSFTKSNHFLLRNSQLNVIGNIGYGQFNNNLVVYFGTRVSYTWTTNLYFSFGIEVGYNYFYDYKSNYNTKSIWSLSVPLKVFI